MRRIAALNAACSASNENIGRGVKRFTLVGGWPG
jgi:hypothetical protein